MTHAKIALHICGRTLVFAAAGAVASAFIGVFSGAILGGILGALNYSEPNTPMLNNTPGIITPLPLSAASVIDNAIRGAAIGIALGAVLGVACGLFVFPIVALLQPASSEVMTAFSEACLGALIGSLMVGLVGLAGGGFSCIALEYLALLPAAFEVNEGFIYGACAGLVTGLFIGALLGGTGRLHYLSWSQLRERLSIHLS